MRIIQVVNVRWYNATAWYGLTLSDLLRKAGHEVRVLTLRETEAHDRALQMGLSPLCLPLNSSSPAGLVRTLTGIRELLQEFKPHIVNCHRGESFLLWGWYKKLSGSFGLVRTRGDQRLPKNNPPNRFLHQRVADAVVATNSAMYEHFRARLGVPASILHCVLGGVDRATFAFDPLGRERVRREFGFSPQDSVIGILGRFDRVKGHQELLQAVSRIHHAHGNRQVRLLLIGFDTAMQAEEIQALAREQGVEEITRITGKRSDIAACISALDLGVVASLWSEAIARAALEIMSCSVPLVGTNVGVMPDLLTPDRLVPPGDVQRLSEILHNHLQDPDKLEQARSEQQERLRSLSFESFLRSTLDIYRSILQ